MSLGVGILRLVGAIHEAQVRGSVRHRGV